MQYLIIFLFWTFVLYSMHWAAHNNEFLQKFHFDHHKYIASHEVKWHWSNILLYTDTWYSTIDVWLTEVIPTIIVAAFFQQWWLLVFYYAWAALVQERIEHNKGINIYPFLTSGKWHMHHHKHPTTNFGIFLPIWDKLFHTESERRV